MLSAKPKLNACVAVPKAGEPTFAVSVAPDTLFVARTIAVRAPVTVVGQNKSCALICNKILSVTAISAAEPLPALILKNPLAGVLQEAAANMFAAVNAASPAPPAATDAVIPAV